MIHKTKVFYNGKELKIKQKKTDKPCHIDGVDMCATICSNLEKCEIKETFKRLENSNKE